jgi:hypothetical protein
MQPMLITPTAVQRGMVVDTFVETGFKLPRTGICRPTGLGDLTARLLTDFAPDGTG